MKKIDFIAALFISFPIVISAQDIQNVRQNIQHIESGKRLQGQILMGRELPPGGVDGSYYLNEDWYKGTVYLSENQTYDDLSLKYNLHSNDLEVFFHKEIKVLPTHLVDSFEWFDSNRQSTVSFINASKYAFEDTKLVGFMEVEQSGGMKLVTRHKMKVRPPTYVKGLDVGDRDTKLYTIEELYLIKDSRVLALQKNHRYNLQFFKDRKEVTEFVKQNKLKLNKKEDLAKAVTFYNNLALLE